MRRIVRSILDWELWHKINGKARELDTEYKFKKEEKMKKIEVCLGVGTDQIFPERTIIEIPKLTKKQREKFLADMMKEDEALGLYLDQAPCKFDHNGECVICDCWPDACAYQRLMKGDYSLESKEELEEMFKNTQNELEKRTKRNTKKK